MTPAELGALGPADVRALLDAWAARERRADLRAAHLTAMYANFHRNTREFPYPFHIADFFPSLDSLRPPPPTAEELGSKWDALAQWAKSQQGAPS